jgi:hypothetical protein
MLLVRGMMLMMQRVMVAVLATAMSVSVAFAAGGSAPLPPPDPTAKGLSPYRIQLRAFDACQHNQARLMNTTREAVHTPCSCYAKGTVNAMSKAEIEAFRETGYFNDTAREKALGFIDKCGLKRP